MPAFEAIDGMPYWVDLSTSDATKSCYFYSKLLGWDIENTDSGYRIARVQGLPVAGFISGTKLDSWVTYFLSRDIDADIATATELGATVLSEPIEVKLGRMAVIADPSGALTGLIEPAGEDSFVAAGEPGTPVWHELSATRDFAASVEFYQKFFEWETVTREGYAIALAEGSAFAGIRDTQGQFPPEVAGFWQSFIGVADLADTCRRAVELGGEIIVEPSNSEFGPVAIIADPVGATLMLAEVEEPVDEDEFSEADDLLNL